MRDTARIVIVGGGLSGLEAALHARERARTAARVTLVSEKSEFTFRPFLTYVPFGLNPEIIRLDLKKITAYHSIQLQIGRVDEVRPRKKLVRFGSQSILYDYLVLATGASMVREPVEGIGRAHVVWDEREMSRLHDRLERAVEGARDGRGSTILFVVPDGCAWTGPLYELVLMMSAWLRRREVRGQFDLRLVTSENGFVEALGPSMHGAMVQELRKQGIAAETARRPVHVEAGHVAFESGPDREFDILVSAAVQRGAGPHEGLETDERGFYRTRTGTRQLLSNEDIYAVGDGSDYPVKQGFLALLQADAAAEHIASRILERPPEFSFEPASFWMMEELSATMLVHAHAGDETVEIERMPAGRLGRLEVMQYLPRNTRLGNPLYAGLLWKGTEVGVRVLEQLSA